MKDLLEKVGKLAQECKPEELPYALMPIVYSKIKNKELLHSDIIESILNYGKEIGFGNILYTSLMNIFKLDGSLIDSDRIEIYTEYSIKNRRRIDLLLVCENDAIIIENKLNNAPDQYNQLNDYYDAIVKEGRIVHKIVYIPNFVTKHAPIEVLRPEVAKVTLVIYPDSLIMWLNTLLDSNEISKNINFTRELINYKHLLQSINIENKRIEENFKIADLLSDDKNILAAYKLYCKWNDIKWHTEWDFWCDFSANICDVIGENCISNLKKFTSDSISSAIHKSRNRDVWYGIAINIAKYDSGETLYLYVERGNKDLRYGLTLVDSENNRISDYSNFQSLQKFEDSIINLSKAKYWIGYKIFTPKVNFDSFSQNETLLLRNNDIRKERIKKYTNELRELIKEIKPILVKIDGLKLETTSVPILMGH